MSRLISGSPFGRIPEGKKKVYSIPKGAIHPYGHQRYICLDVNVQTYSVFDTSKGEQKICLVIYAVHIRF